MGQRIDAMPKFFRGAALTSLVRGHRELHVCSFTYAINKFGQNNPGEQDRKLMLPLLERLIPSRKPLDFRTEDAQAGPQLIPIRDIASVQRFHIDF